MFSAIKDPQADLDYVFDWTAWLGSDTINASTWTATPGVTLHGDSIDVGGAKTVVWISGGTARVLYTVTNHIVTTSGRRDDRSLILTVADK